jgi:hypothetical protein
VRIRQILRRWFSGFNIKDHPYILTRPPEEWPIGRFRLKLGRLDQTHRGTPASQGMMASNLFAYHLKELRTGWPCSNSKPDANAQPLLKPQADQVADICVARPIAEWKAR